MQERLDSVGATLTSYPGPPESRVMLESIDQQTVEIGLRAAAKCQKIYQPPLLFRKKSACVGRMEENIQRPPPQIVQPLP